MQLRHLLLKNFRRFDRIEVNFQDGLNLIKGPNEAGKSTLQDAIIIGLLDRPTGKQRERRYQQWGEERLYEIDLVFQSLEGEQITISKNFNAGTHQVIHSKGASTSKAALESTILESLGTLSQDLFESTACIRQDAMMELDSGAGEISTQLQGILLGGDGRVDQVLDLLTKKVAESERGWKTSAPRNPGPIRVLQQKVEDIRLEISRIEPEIAKKIQAGEELQKHGERLERIGRELQDKRELYGIHGKKRELRELLDVQIDREKELERRIEKVEELTKQIAELHNQLGVLSRIATLGKGEIKALREANHQYQARSIEEKDREVQLSELLEQVGPKRGSDEKSKGVPGWLPAGLLLTGIGLGVWGLLMLLMPERMMSAWLGPVFLGLGGALAIGGTYWLGRSGNAIRRYKKVEQDQITAAKRRYTEGVRSAQDAREELYSMMSNVGYDNWDNYLLDLEEVAEIRNRLVASESTLAALVNSEGDLETLKSERKGVSRDRRDTEELLEELVEYGDLKPAEFQRLVRTLGELELDERDCKEQIVRFETILKSAGPTVGDLHRYRELLAANQRRLEHALDHHEVLLLTLEGMKRAREASMSTAQDELEPRLSRYLEQVTGGRYDRAIVDDELGLKIHHPAKEMGPIEMDELSQGTRDQVYLSARFALSDLIFGEAKPPLLMDDPFVKFDPERRDAALKLCKDLAEDRQIILFTCQEGYEAYADHVIELE